jgi:predicted  nucleic acid-binding Zn-ribbon protein
MSVAAQLYRLQLVDSEWDERSQSLAQVESSLGETNDLLLARKSEAEAKEELTGMRSQLRSLELEVAGVNTKLKSNQDRLYSGRVRNPKELSGLHEEAAALRRRRSELEDQQLELMIAIEGAEAELAERQARLRQIEANWREDQAALVHQKEDLECRLEELEEQRTKVRARIGAADLANYDDLRSRFDGVAVARLKGGICQVCGVDVPVSVARAVERGEGEHYCTVCNRLLFGG